MNRAAKIYLTPALLLGHPRVQKQQRENELIKLV